MKTRILSLILLSTVLVAAVSCSSSSSTGTETISSQASDTSDSAETNAAYVYPELDCGGEAFTILNCANTWGMYCSLDFEQMTGEVLDDMVYKRNCSVEERFNVNINVIEAPLKDISTMLQTSVTAGDDEYDIAYPRGTQLNSLISSNYLVNLYAVNGLQLDEPWWYRNVISEATLPGDRVYFALNNFSLSAFDLVWCVYFNEDKLTALGLDLPYELVREGKWTLDELGSMVKQCANLNGDSSYSYDENGKATYGMTSYYAVVGPMLIGSDLRFTAKASDGIPKLSIESDKFYSVVDRLSSLFGTEGAFYQAESSNYAQIFKSERSVFYGGEVKTANSLRSYDFSFGIVPMPKYDENQADYISWMAFDTPTLCIPVTNTKTDRTGSILDALSYLSYSEVLPTYYDIRISEKSLRNKDSVEMLEIINSSLYYDASQTYGWTSELYSQLRTKIFSGSSEVASIIEANRAAVTDKITKTIEAYQ